MAALILESFVGSKYSDSPVAYEFPSQYLRHFKPLSHGVRLFIVIYEPRGHGEGRMAYVGWTTATHPPVLTGRRSGQGRELWRVQYDRPAEMFDRLVPREIASDPLEGWLRPLERGRARNVATFGRAVRPLADEDLTRILELGSAGALDTTYPSRDEHLAPAVLVAERPRRLIETIEREATFRRRVLEAYEFRCAVSGFGLGRVSRDKPQDILDAAHIRPVSRQGSDVVGNGLPLTPTLHRLFDAGLFTVRYGSKRPEIQVSSHLDPSMVESRERGFVLGLHDGLQLLLPQDKSLWPHPEYLRYHLREVFKSD